MSEISYYCISLPCDDYRDEVQELVANVFDIAVNCCGLQELQAQDAFVASGLASQIEGRNPAIVAGKSAADVVADMLQKTGVWVSADCLDDERMARSPQYWGGYVLAFAHCETGASFRRLLRAVPFFEIVGMYNPLHEADESKFVEVVKNRLVHNCTPSNLQRIRQASGFTQAQLSVVSGVGLRSIQMYEQRNKDINKAQGLTLRALARALHCDMESIMEV